MLKTVVIGVKPSESNFKAQPLVESADKLNFMNSLYIHKELAKPEKEVTGVLERIRAEVVMKRIRIREFFLDFDTLRKNVVTKDQFLRIVKNYNIGLPQEELELLCRHYSVGDADNRVRWMDFCEDVDKVWTIKGLEKDPLLKVQPYQETQTLPVRREPIVLSAEEQSQLERILGLYRQEISNKRVLIKNHFMDFDVTKQGFITKNQFLRILDMFRIKADERSMNLILKKYADKGNLNEINYFDFCRDVDLYN